MLNAHKGEPQNTSSYYTKKERNCNNHRWKGCVAGCYGFEQQHLDAISKEQKLRLTHLLHSCTYYRSVFGTAGLYMFTANAKLMTDDYRLTLYWVNKKYADGYWIRNEGHFTCTEGHLALQ